MNIEIKDVKTFINGIEVRNKVDRLGTVRIRGEIKKALKKGQ